MLTLPSPRPVTDDSTTSSAGAELVTTDGRALPLVAATLTGEARGGLARLVLEQRFENRHAETLHVTYRMPLPADGAVSAYAFTIADRTIAGRVDKKADARAQFEQAIAAGHTAALLEQERADIFTQELGNLPAGEAIVARITVDVRLAWLDEGEWELRFPTVIGPRYVGRADSADDARATHVHVADGDTGARVRLAIRIGDPLAGGRGPSSPTHPVVTTDGVVALRAGARLDRDLVVRWPVATAEVGLTLDRARGDTGAHGLLTVVPPARSARAQAIARDLTVLLDTSGSMGGAPLATAKQVVALLIESLGEADRLELIEFSSRPRRYQAEPVAATARAKLDAIGWVRSRTASGGTEMRAGVLEALRPLRPDAQRQVIVVTDGYVGGEQQILRALGELLPPSCRLHVLGVGAAVNRSLATALARAGRGAEVLAGLDEDPERAARRLIARTRAPQLTQVEITGSALIDHAPAHVPDVFEGAPLLAALALRPEGGELVVRGLLASGRWEQRVHVGATAAGDGNPAIAALYARERVADLEVRAAMDEPAAVDGEIEALGLRYQIATRLTSWVAIDATRTVTGPSRHEVMPQELPYGTTAAAFGLRVAAAPMAVSAPAHAAPMKAMAFRMDTGAYPAMEPSRRQVSAVAPPALAKPRGRRWTFWLLLILVLAAIGAAAWWLLA